MSEQNCGPINVVEKLHALCVLAIDAGDDDLYHRTLALMRQGVDKEIQLLGHYSRIHMRRVIRGIFSRDSHVWLSLYSNCRLVKG